MSARLKSSSTNRVLVASETQLPNFEADALSRLSKKIELNLHKAPPEKPSKADRIKPRRSKTQSINTAEVSLPIIKKAPNELKYPVASKGHKALPLPAPLPKQHGKKRLRDGQVKGSSSLPKGADGTKHIRTMARDAQPSQSGLEEDVLALGGSLDDYKLVADISSSSEIEGDDREPARGSRKSLGQDLQKFVQDLGIDQRDRKEPEQSSMFKQKEQVNIESKKSKHMKNKILAPEKDEPSKSVARRPLGNGSPRLYFEPLSEWYSTLLPEIPTPAHAQVPLSPDLAIRLRQHAKSLLELENTHYALRSKSASSANQFYATIMTSGTLSDKISALTLSVQESPLHNMKALESLVGLARKRSRGQAVEVLGALKDLFGPGALLPSDRKLKAFSSQPGLYGVSNSSHTWTSEDRLPAPLEEVHLVSWAYEDWLKSTYFEVLKILETWCNDEVVFARSKAVDYVYQLLKEKPEQEANLLRLLVNKLGDTDKKVASKTSYNVLQLENFHPLMKPTIVASIESDLLFRPGQSLHAKYYAIITLNQTVLSGKEEGVARKLLDIYFSLFVELLERPSAEKPSNLEVNTKILNSKGEVQGGGGASGKKAQRKVKTKQKNTGSDEETREKMLSAVLTGVNRAMPYTTTDDESFERHLDTLFRVTHSSNFNTSIQALMLIQQLIASHPSTNDRFYRTLYESLLDPRLLTSSKQTLYLNVLFRALKSDVNVKRIKAFSKRLLQVIAMHQASFACGTLYLVRELENVFASLRALIDDPEEDDSDEEENFQDVVENTENSQISFSEGTRLSGVASPARASRSQVYDGRKRDPEHSNAEKSCLWELAPLLLHFHPSVVLFASKITSHEAMPPKPDLSLHTLIHFLDRFVYKNPKLAGGPRGASIMQPMAGGDASGLLVSAQSKLAISGPVNSEAFWKMESDKVGADEVFFHKYFSTMGKGKEKAQKRKAELKGEIASDGEEDNEDEIWKALVDSRPELEGSEASDNVEELDTATENGEEDEAGSLDAGSDDVKDIDAEADSETMEFDDDDEALLGSDEEIPSHLDSAFANDQKRFGVKHFPEAPEESKRGKKRRKLKNLPTFASAEDYAAMLDDDDE